MYATINVSIYLPTISDFDHNFVLCEVIASTLKIREVVERQVDKELSKKITTNADECLRGDRMDNPRERRQMYEEVF